MSNLIDRNDAVEAIEFKKVYMTAYKVSSNGYVSEGNPLKQYNKGLDDAIKAVNSLPSAEPERKWIPVTERLPEEEEDVLVTRHFLGNKDIPASTYVEVARWDGDAWYSDSDEYKLDFSKHTDPVAWMPLPEQYREGER